MCNPYLLNIIGLVLEIVGVIYIGSYLIVVWGNDKIFRRVLEYAFEHRKRVGTQQDALQPIERSFMKIGFIFLVSGLVFQIYANYIQGRC